MTDIDTYLKDISTYSKRVELYHYEYIEPMLEVYEEATIPSPIEIFISDLYFNKLNLPDTLFVLDLWFDSITDFEFNMPPKLEEILLINANISNKTLMELFPDNLLYNYSSCYLNGTPIYKCLYDKYTKYFPYKPINKPDDTLNSTCYRYQKTFINEIKEYEARIQQGKAFCLAIKEELVAAVWHPDKVEKLINAYGIDIIDIL
jgi:hypothetical protein